MADWLQLFAVARFGRPLVLFAALWSTFWITAKALRSASVAAIVLPIARRLLFGLAALGLVAFAAIAIWYATDERYYDFAEPTMPAVAWMFKIGKPVYPPPDAADRYAHIYGPMAFVPHAFAMRLFGAGLTVTKWVGTAAGLLALLLVFLSLRSVLTTWRAVVFTGYCALLLLVFRNVAFWNRPDSLELLCVSMALWAIQRRTSIAAWLLLGVSAGVLWNLKFSGPLYSLPLFALFLERAGTRPVLLAAVTAAVFLVLPFAALSNVSFHDYLIWIRLSAGNGIVWSTLRQNVEWGLYLLVPIGLALRARARQEAPPLVSSRVTVAFCLAMCGVVVLASKPGAGPYHLLPFIPIACFLTAAQVESLRGDAERALVLPCLAFVVVAFLISLAQQTSFISTVREINAIDPIADVTEFSSQHPGATLELGYSSDERMTFIRPLLVFRSNQYLLDQPAIQEHQLSGIGIPAATRAALRSCAVTFWLLPKEGTPFSAVNRYPKMAGRPLFDDEFRRAFFDSYRPAGATKFFNVWACAAN